MNEQRIIRRALKDNPEALRPYNDQYDELVSLREKIENIKIIVTESVEADLGELLKSVGLTFTVENK